MELGDLGRGLGTGAAGGGTADIAEGNGLDIAADAVGEAVSGARELLAALGLELPFSLVFDVIGVMP